MKNEKFNNLNEFFDNLISSLSSGEIDLIKNSNPEGIHMALSRWVQNNIVNNAESNVSELVTKRIIKNNDEISYVHNDNIAGFIIDELIERLKN
ncbi:MAG: hypothetical protein GTO02_15005 [Candidatus Dadabacteria bacterium]|nr:hypothetical protein [Candidatus Dadabacteria bacterium]NIQ15650.1 hypothetical protein [Candidatus Dadabacteria bacterium]